MLNIYARSPEAIDWSDTRCTANRVVASEQSKPSCSRRVREYSVEGVRHLQQNGHVFLHVYFRRAVYLLCNNNLSYEKENIFEKETIRC